MHSIHLHRTGTLQLAAFASKFYWGDFYYILQFWLKSDGHTDELHGDLYICMTALVLMLVGVVLLLLHELPSSVLLCGHFCVRNTGFKLGRVALWCSKCLFQVTVCVKSSNSLVLADGGGKCWCKTSLLVYQITNECFYPTTSHTQKATSKQFPVVSGVPRNFVRRGGGSTNSVENRGQREW